jgi:LysM repeat protein
MQRVSDEHGGAGAPAAPTRGRWLFALVVFAIGIVPVTEIAKAVGPSSAPACPGATYSVVKGDSWSKIASRSKVTMAALINANAATTATVIHPGQTLCVPSGAPLAATPTTAAPATKPAAPVTSVSIDVFPVQGPCSFSDTYAAPRSGGRVHEGVDVIAKAGQWVYAVKAGTLTKKYLNAPGSLSGNGWRLTAGDGTYFFYAHLSAFATGLAVGSPVAAGQIIGQIGMTGAAPIPHLHFEVHPGGGASIDPTAVVKAVDGCKNSAVPPQPNGIPTVVTPTTVPVPTVPATPVPATTAPAKAPAATVPAPTVPAATVPAATVPTTTVAPYVPSQDHRREGDPAAPVVRPRR